jgi:hypothetical protein
MNYNISAPPDDHAWRFFHLCKPANDPLQAAFQQHTAVQVAVFNYPITVDTLSEGLKTLLPTVKG